jgi:hypothetical protein
MQYSVANDSRYKAGATDDIDLADLYLAYLGAIAARTRTGEIKDADAFLLDAQIRADMTTLARQRRATNTAAWGQAMQGWAAYQQSIQPQSRFINCNPNGMGGFQCF